MGLFVCVVVCRLVVNQWERRFRFGWFLATKFPPLIFSHKYFSPHKSLSKKQRFLSFPFSIHNQSKTHTTTHKAQTRVFLDSKIVLILVFFFLFSHLIDPVFNSILLRYVNFVSWLCSPLTSQVLSLICFLYLIPFKKVMLI